MKLTSCKDQLQQNQLVFESVSTSTPIKFQPNEKMSLCKIWKRSTAKSPISYNPRSTKSRNVWGNENYLPINHENGIMFSNHIMQYNPWLQVNQPQKRKSNNKARKLKELKRVIRTEYCWPIFLIGTMSPGARQHKWKPLKAAEIQQWGIQLHGQSSCCNYSKIYGPFSEIMRTDC